MMEPTEKYQTSLISKPGIREMINAGTAKSISRVRELNSGGSVFPIPWNTLDDVKTIPTEMKFNETIRRYSLPKAITRVSREKMRISLAGAEYAISVSKSIINGAIPIAE